MHVRKSWIEVKSVNFHFSAIWASTNYYESSKPDPKSLALIESEKSVVECGFPKNGLSKKAKSKT